MTKPTILITGGSGLLALNWAATVHNDWAVVLALHNREINLSFAKTIKLDLLDADAVIRTLDDVAPDLVVHTAGLTNVETCEAAPEIASNTNVLCAQILAKACEKQSVKLVLISTDHLFGDRHPLATESTPLSPINVYGQTKADGETAALDACPDAIVARTNFFCWGPTYRRSFSDTIIASLRANEAISLFTDVYFTPILAKSLVEVAHVLVQKDSCGIFNISGNERLSKHDFGLKIAHQFGLDASLIRTGQYLSRTDLVLRPREMSLSNNKARAIFDQPFSDLDHYLKILADQEQAIAIRELRKL